MFTKNHLDLIARVKLKSASILSLCSGYVQNNMANKVIDLFNKIKNPDEIIINLLFNAWAQLGTKEALNLVKNSFKRNSKIFSFKFLSVNFFI